GLLLRAVVAGVGDTDEGFVAIVLRHGGQVDLAVVPLLAALGDGRVDGFAGVTERDETRVHAVPGCRVLTSGGRLVVGDELEGRGHRWCSIALGGVHRM